MYAVFLVYKATAYPTYLVANWNNEYLSTSTVSSNDGI